MPYDDLFATLDRTVVMPTPGGCAAPGCAFLGELSEALETTANLSGFNSLIAAVNCLLNVIPQVRASTEHLNLATLRESLVQGVCEFEARARVVGAQTEKIIAARYVFCIVIDETVMSTPWGASGVWAQHGLLALFYGETGGGEKFFQLLVRLAENFQVNLDLLELMYVCLEFGFEGRYWVIEGGQRQLEAIRQCLLWIICKRRGEYEREFSPNWWGVLVAIQSRLSLLPLWAVGVVAALFLVGIFFGFRLSFSRVSDLLVADIAVLRVALRMSFRFAFQSRLVGFLTNEIQRGLVAIDDRADRSVVTILGDGLFRFGEASVGANDQWFLSRIGDALASVFGQIDVIGYTDNVPIRTLRFLSNWELFKARAESVVKLFASRVPLSRFRADGCGEAEFVLPNDTFWGRARNRRVEITLYVLVVSTSFGIFEGLRKP